MPWVDVVKCNGCGLCVGVCQHQGLIMADNRIKVVEREDCDWCTHCEAVCPTGAILCPYDIILPR